MLKSVEAYMIPPIHVSLCVATKQTQPLKPQPLKVLSFLSLESGNANCQSIIIYIYCKGEENQTVNCVLYHTGFISDFITHLQAAAASHHLLRP